MLSSPASVRTSRRPHPMTLPTLTLALLVAGQADPLNTLTESEKADGWKLLFDGKSADQWRNYGKQTLSDKWQVKDGALALTGGGGGDIVTKEKFGSFELTLEYKISPKGNSGLMF